MNKMTVMIKGTGEGRKKTGFLKYAVAITLIVMLVAGLVLTTYSDNLNEGLSENLIRLHVLANSDSEEDQALKRDVRDVVLKYMKEKLENSDDKNKTKNIIVKDIDKIKEIAKKEIVRQGKNYNVTATMGNFPFPTKAYGDVTLPAGYYEALRIVIGEGDGANWWCVLFPPLCFVDATHGTVPDDVKEKLKKSLSEEEYNILTTSDSDDVPVKVKFKLLEVIQGSKIKFSGAIKKLFSFI
jgi:stage II sporulation protein R